MAKLAQERADRVRDALRRALTEQANTRWFGSARHCWGRVWEHDLAGLGKPLTELGSSPDAQT